MNKGELIEALLKSDLPDDTVIVDSWYVPITTLRVEHGEMRNKKFCINKSSQRKSEQTKEIPILLLMEDKESDIEDFLSGTT